MCITMMNRKHLPISLESRSNTGLEYMSDIEEDYSQRSRSCYLYHHSSVKYILCRIYTFLTTRLPQMNESWDQPDGISAVSCHAQ